MEVFGSRVQTSVLGNVVRFPTPQEKMWMHRNVNARWIISGTLQDHAMLLVAPILAKLVISMRITIVVSVKQISSGLLRTTDAIGNATRYKKLFLVQDQLRILVSAIKDTNGNPLLVNSHATEPSILGVLSITYVSVKPIVSSWLGEQSVWFDATTMFSQQDSFQLIDVFARRMLSGTRKVMLANVWLTTVWTKTAETVRVRWLGQWLQVSL